jgi:NAD(P)-dependent dehydrogenase (short-subunit alcohol dehydrogenase family)
MPSQIIVLTGGMSGLGRRAALQLAEQGHLLVVVGRDAARGASLLQELRVRGGQAEASMFVVGDISTLAGMEHVATQIRSRIERVDGLINNAGVMLPTRRITADGLELNFAVNHVAPFVLTGRLLGLLRRGRARIVNVNSEGHRAPLRGRGPVELDFDDLQSSRRYDPFMAYSRSKLANLLFTYELPRRQGHDVTVNAVHPGLVRTDLGRLFPRLQVAAFNLFALPPAEGARPVVHLATSDETSSIGGRYFNRFTEVASSTQSYDTAAAHRLWQVTEQLAGSFHAQPDGKTGVR